MTKYFKLFLPPILYKLLFFIFILITGTFIENYEIIATMSYLFAFILVAIIFKSWRKYLKVDKINLRYLSVGIIITLLFFILMSYIRSYLLDYQINIGDIEFKTTFSTYKILAAIFISPIFEEIINRGVILEKACKEELNLKLVSIISSILFGISHLPDLFSFFTFTIFGLILASYYLRTRNLLNMILMHCFYNFLVSFLM